MCVCRPSGRGQALAGEHLGRNPLFPEAALCPQVPQVLTSPRGTHGRQSCRLASEAPSGARSLADPWAGVSVCTDHDKQRSCRPLNLLQPRQVSPTALGGVLAAEETPRRGAGPAWPGPAEQRWGGHWPTWPGAHPRLQQPRGLTGAPGAQFPRGCGRQWSWRLAV